MKSGESVTKHQISLKQTLVTAVLVALVVCILTSVTSKTPFAKASDQSIQLFPTQVPPGKTVVINGHGFADGVPVTISFNGVTVATTQGYGFQNLLSVSFTVPSDAAYGTYDVTATNNAGSATAKFTVASSVPSPTDTPSETSPPDTSGETATYSPGYTFSPPQSQDNGLSSGAIAGIGVIVAIAIIIPVLFVLRGRSHDRDLLLEREREPMPYRSDSYAQPPSRPASPYNPPTSRYGSTSRYNQSSTYGHYSTRPTPTSRYNAPSSGVRQQSALGKTCPYCKRSIRESYRTCPYCYKKIQ